MHKLIKIVAALLVLVIVAAVAVPFFVPLEKYKEQIAAQVKAATGRDLVIGGKISASIFPTLGVDISQVSLSSPAGFAAKQMLQADNITLEVGLGALFGKQVDIKRFILTRPIINLEVNAAGKNNWEFGVPDPMHDPITDKVERDSTAASKGNFLSGLMLGDVKITDGEVHYRDGKSKKTYDLTALNVKAELPSLQQPFAGNGEGIWNGEKVVLKLALANPQDYMDGKATNFKMDVKSAHVSLKYEGKASQNGAVGPVSFDIPSVPKLAKWAGSAFAWKGTAPLAFSVNGDLSAGPDVVSLSKAEIALDAIKFKGDLKAALSGAIPAIEAKLATDSLDINPYMAKQQAMNSLFISPAYAMEPWSNDKIDLSNLRTANANISITTNAFLVNKIKLQKTVLNIGLTGGLLKVSVPEAALYGGNATSNVSLDASGALTKEFAITNVNAGAFLKDAADMDRFEGTLNSSGSISGKLLSQRALMESLSGSGVVKLTDGAIKGVDLASMLRNVQSAFKDVDTSKQKTDFSELGGTFTIANGIVTNKDLAMKAPLLRLSGQGTVNLPSQQINYRLTPMIIASAQGQGGKEKQGLGVPILVSGPLDRPSFMPDLEGMARNVLENPEALKNTVKSVKEQLKSGSGGAKDLKNLFKGFGKSKAE